MSLFLHKEEKKETFILLSITRLEEDGKVDMHSPMILVHTRTSILHYCSIEMHIAAIFSQVFSQEEFFSLTYGCLFPDLPASFEGEGGGEWVPMRFPPFPLFY